MSLKLHFASLSLGAAVDQQTGSLSVFDVIEEVRTPQLPIQIQSLVISLALAQTEPVEFKGKMLIHLITPDGKQQMIGNGEMHVPAEQKRMKAVFRYNGFPIQNYGAYRFVLSWVNGAGVKTGEAILNFDVIQVPMPEQQGAPGDRQPVTH